MELVCPESLAETLDAVIDARFYGREMSPSDRCHLAEWLVDRGRMPGGYRLGMVAPTRKDYENGVRLWTGERIWSKAGMGLVLGNEAARTLITLSDEFPHAEQIILPTRSYVTECLANSRSYGGFCCGKCSVSIWRLALQGGLPNRPTRIKAALDRLHNERTDDGRWHAFPFYYTLLVLSELDTAAAKAEKRYAAPLCERLVKRPIPPDPYGKRKFDLIRRVLSQV